ncbi:MAG: hypothetical protein G5Z42_07105 [Caldisphaeraceae archaeon]|nr:hypothetical protein [Caldisphaeraceae archaeon]MEB3691791.1 hypothetical protein [Caldisphaeraceae archaeon]MEB3798565.1 hypothetical protein [Caldisphaeraceae archaeon]
MEPIVREGLEVMLRGVNKEIAVVEVRLQRIATVLGIKNWKELDELFTMKGVDNPEVDMLWPKYLYLRRRLKELEERKKDILMALEGR